jgi:hypothetical protein
VFHARADGKIPVMSGPRIIELAGPERVSRLVEGCNVKVIRKRKTGAIVELQILPHGDDSRMPPKWGNPQKLSHRAETDDNPAGSWMFKRLAGVAETAG